ncbi:hypothetical protein K9M48_01800 [Candidatus Gracilibacteria bacterium]|nr:hypothetical protein [Candidatus Gracilibacteria bacterium]
MIKYKKYIIFVSFILILLIILFFQIPSFKNTINLELFYQSQINEIISISDVSLDKTQGSILLNNSKLININKGIYYYPINLENNITISFPIQEKYIYTFIYIKLYNGNIIEIKPHSVVQIRKIKDKFEFNLLNGQLEFYKDDNLNFTGKNNIKQLNPKNKNIQLILDKINNQIKTYILDQYGGNIIINNTLNKLISLKLKFLYFIYPSKYIINITNYQTFISNINNFGININNIIQFKENEKKEIQKSILNELKKGLNQTNNF